MAFLPMGCLIITRPAWKIYLKDILGKESWFSIIKSTGRRYKALVEFLERCFGSLQYCGESTISAPT